jgi:hypothetical protein
LLYKTLGGAALLTLVLVPVASAKPPVRVRLPLLPLQSSSLGSVTRGLKLAHDSGLVSNTAAADQTADATPATLKKLGRVSGYALDYGDSYSGASGVTDVMTSVEQYKTAAEAKHGLAFWRKEDSELGSLDAGGFSMANTVVKVRPAGKKHFAYLTSYRASDIAPLSMVDERFTDSRYVFEVDVSAGTSSAAVALASKLAKKLDARLRLALAGRLRGKPVKLPAKQTAGPPTGGPALSSMALTTTDLLGDGPSLFGAGYTVDPFAASDYSVLMSLAPPPGGTVPGLLDQEIEWYPTANEASFNADFENALALAEDPARTTVLDLSSLGYGARGSVDEGTQDNPVSTGEIVFNTGQLAEYIFIGIQGALGTQDPTTNAADAAANHIKTVLGG